jgi:hypothetical protein
MKMMDEKTVKTTVRELVGVHGPAQMERIELGVAQAARFWTKADGTPEEFKDFCKTHFIADSAQLRLTFERIENNLESLYGHAAEASRDLKEPMDLDMGPMLPVDYLFAGFATGAHLNEDLFQTKIAFVALLNFPATTIEEKLASGGEWTRMQWAEARLADAFIARVPASVNQTVSRAYVDAEDYINTYNLCMHHLLDENGDRPFPAGLRLISHWGIRDELKARYADPEGLPKQRMIQRVMERIVLQEIPASVIDNPALDWEVARNAVRVSPVKDLDTTGKSTVADNTPEGNRRYVMWLGVAAAERRMDPYFPSLPSLIDRRFKRQREMPEARVEELLVSVLGSDQVRRAGRLIEKRLGRPLEPFDIWYNGFKAQGALPETDLNRIVSRKYPTRDSFQAGLPDLLRKLAFPAATADFLASKINVDPARGIGHAMEAGRRVDNAHLRTRIGSTGMDFKGYNIAVHELGHNCEQVLTLNRMDHILLRGVPNTAFTEAFAFVFQKRDLDLLGIRNDNPLRESLEALDVLWGTAEIAGVALVDMNAWRWLVAHPGADPGEFKSAVIDIAKSVWNAYFAPNLGSRDQVLLAVYSHMVDAGLYLPDYPLGHLIAFQIEEYMKGKKIGVEMERMCRSGCVTPDLWMQTAVAEPVSSKPLLDAASSALDLLEGG